MVSDLTLRKIALFSCFWVMFVNFSWANDISTENISECTAIKSNSKRLFCFDKLFGTPVQEQEIDEKVLKGTIPLRVMSIFELAQQKAINLDDGDELQLALYDESETKNAAIYIACQDNITRFQIALKDAITKNPLKVNILDTKSNKLVSSINWQYSDNGYLLDAGRGLYAIQQLKSILYLENLTISIPEENRTFKFESNGLASRVSKIRNECGW